MAATPQTIEKKYARLRMTLTILTIVFVLFLLMAVVYGKVQRSLAIKLQEMNVQLESKNEEMNENLTKAINEAQQARMEAEVQRKIAMENELNCAKSKK